MSEEHGSSIRRVSVWVSLLVVTALGAWISDVAGMGFRHFLPSPERVVCWLDPTCTPQLTVEEMTCSDTELVAMAVPAGLVKGIASMQTERLHLNRFEDSFCDYCRFIRYTKDGQDTEEVSLMCTLGTADGLSGSEFVSGPFDPGCPGTGEWVIHKGEPAFRRKVGNKCEKVAVNPVTGKGVGEYFQVVTDGSD